MESGRGPGFSGNDPTHPEVSGVIIITGMRDLPRDPRGVPNPFPMFPTGPPENILDFRGSKFDQNPNRPRGSIGNRLKFHMAYLPGVYYRVICPPWGIRPLTLKFPYVCIVSPAFGDSRDLLSGGAAELWRCVLQL